MKINSIKDICIGDITPMNENDSIDSLECNLYGHNPKLSEVLNLTQSVIEGWDYDLYINKFFPVNVFGYYYTHGLLFENEKNFKTCLYAGRRKFFDEYKSQLEENVSLYEARNRYFRCGEFERNEINIHYNILKPMQDDCLNAIKQKYLQPDIVASLLALNVDIEKFWYVLLWLMHYINSKFTNQFEKFRPALDCFEELCETIETENLLYNNDKNLLSDEKECELKYNLVLETHDRCGKNAVNIDNPLVLMTIKNLVEKYLKDVIDSTEEPPLCYSDPQPTKRDMVDINLSSAASDKHYFYNNNRRPKSISTKAKLYWFREYLKVYLKNYEGVQGKCVGDFIDNFEIIDIENKVPSHSVSIDKEWLISRLSCVVGYGSDGVFNNPNQKDKLKTTLRNINMDSVKGYSNIYKCSK